jgi:RimJ/RimL family protein N-acetyltransferase
MSLRLITPFPDDAWADVWQWIQPFRHRIHDDFSPNSEETFVAWMRQRTEGQFTVGVVRDDKLGGLIWCEGNAVSGNVHAIFSKAFWGSATSVPALDAAARCYFLTTGARKLNTQFFRHNGAVRSMVKTLGLQREGILRSMTMQGGEPVDVETWGITREEFFARNSTGHNQRPANS